METINKKQLVEILKDLTEKVNKSMIIISEQRVEISKLHNQLHLEQSNTESQLKLPVENRKKLINKINNHIQTIDKSIKFLELIS